VSRRDRASSVDGPAAPGAGRPITAALLPVRFFFGATFLYAGLDKLLDARFFDAANPASIQAQMLAFTRVSPVAPIVRLGEPLAVPIGLAIALLEIAVGLGALTGLAFRAAAAAGAGLSLLFFLTASWATRPYYVGADLPYAAGWISLAIAGHGGLFVPRRLLDWASGIGGARSAAASPATGARRERRGPRPAVSGPVSLPMRDRRTVLQAGVLGVLALVVASLAVPFRRAGAGAPAGDAGSSADAGVGNPAPGSDSAASSGPAPTAGSSATAAALVVAHVADVAKTGARSFTVPFAAPPPFPSGDPAVIVRLMDGSFVAFDAVCTHAGCTVEWDRAERLLFCPCHGATFDPADRGAVVGDGPTNQPLPSIPIVVDAATGAISLRA